MKKWLEKWERDKKKFGNHCLRGIHTRGDHPHGVNGLECRWWCWVNVCPHNSQISQAKAGYIPMIIIYNTVFYHAYPNKFSFAIMMILEIFTDKPFQYIRKTATEFHDQWLMSLSRNVSYQTLTSCVKKWDRKWALGNMMCVTPHMIIPSVYTNKLGFNLYSQHFSYN